MQRQSLGSPSRAPPLYKSDTVSKLDESKRRESTPSIISVTGDDEIKPEKPLRSHPAQSEKLIHLIPFLILFCFLVLYFSSHDPSPPDLAAQFIRIKQVEKLLDSSDIEEFVRVNKELKGGDLFAIRSLQNLEEDSYENDDDNSKWRVHRKLGDF